MGIPTNSCVRNGEMKGSWKFVIIIQQSTGSTPRETNALITNDTSIDHFYATKKRNIHARVNGNRNQSELVGTTVPSDESLDKRSMGQFYSFF